MSQLFRYIIFKNSRFRLPVVQEIQSSLRQSQKSCSSIVRELCGRGVHRTEGRGHQRVLKRSGGAVTAARARHGAHQRRQWRRLLTQRCNPCILAVYGQQLKRDYGQRCGWIPPEKPCTNNCLSQTEYSAFRLTHVKKDAEDTYKYTFKFWQKCGDPGYQDCRMIIKPGQHLNMLGDTLVEGKLVNKPYAVYVHPKDKLSFNTVIKIWPKGVISTYIRCRQIGDIVYWRGPFGDFQLSHKWDHILLIGKGTCMSWLYAVIWDILQDFKCETRLRLFHCCHNEDNINLRYELHDLATYYNFKYDIFLGENTTENFEKLETERTHSRMLEEKDIKKYFEKKKNNYRVLLCGPPEFKGIVNALLMNNGVKPELIHKF